MGFAKYARATTVDPAITAENWVEIRQAGVGLDSPFQSRKASQVVLDKYDPKQFLLSHCTIIASVDTEAPGQPLGQQMVDGVQINRTYPDYFITTATSKYINNNHDAWERKLLLSAYKSFVGGENYVEHIQIPELSKGKIIDAAARDIGDSIYVDILVATDRKHKSLIESIASGQMGTLSMGCQVAWTVCSKCGNVAEDELQLCNHIKYLKGKTFFDHTGKQRRIAELCGHINAEPGSVKFIEASWVANPAFKGAVLRNILNPAEAQMADQMRNRIQIAFLEPARVTDPTCLQKAARDRSLSASRLKTYTPGQGVKAIPSDHLAFLYDGDPIGSLNAPKPFSAEAKAIEALEKRKKEIAAQQDFPGQNQSEAPKAEEDPLNKVVDDLYNDLRTKVVERVRNDLDKEESNKVRKVLNENDSNESLIKSALQYTKWQQRAALIKGSVTDPKVARNILAGLILHDFGGWEAVANVKRFSGREILVMSRLLDRMTKKASLAGDSRIYRTVLTVGGTNRYANVEAFLTACRQVVGRQLLETEKTLLLEKGHLFSLGL